MGKLGFVRCAKRAYHRGRGRCRLKAVASGASDAEVEAQLENQLESMIQHCDDELGLIPRMAGNASCTPPPPFPLLSPSYAIAHFLRLDLHYPDRILARYCCLNPDLVVLVDVVKAMRQAKMSDCGRTDSDTFKLVLGLPLLLIITASQTETLGK